MVIKHEPDPDDIAGVLELRLTRVPPPSFGSTPKWRLPHPDEAEVGTPYQAVVLDPPEWYREFAGTVTVQDAWSTTIIYGLTEVSRTPFDAKAYPRHFLDRSASARPTEQRHPGLYPGLLAVNRWHHATPRQIYRVEVSSAVADRLGVSPGPVVIPEPRSGTADSAAGAGEADEVCPAQRPLSEWL